MPEFESALMVMNYIIFENKMLASIKSTQLDEL